MDKKLELAHNEFIAGIGRMSSAFGLNRFVTQLYGLLYLSERPLSLDEMAEALGVSKGNVSINVRELEKWGAVRNIWVKGSRKDYYQAEGDLKKFFLNKVKSSIQKRSGELTTMLEDFERTIESLNNGANKEKAQEIMHYKRKLKEIKKLRDTALNAVKLFSKFI